MSGMTGRWSNSKRRRLIVLALLVSVTSCKRQPPPPPPPPTVTVARPVHREVIEWDEYTGRLDAVESVEVRARVGGLIMSTPFQEGAIVKKGDLLVEIDARPFQAELDSKIAAEKQAEAQVQLAQITYDHTKELMPAQSASEIEWRQAEANLDQAKAVLAGAKANVNAAELNVEWTRVIAPIDGRISRRYVTPGNVITGGTGTGTLLTTITSIDPIYCYLDADERSVLRYQKMAREGTRVSARQGRVPCFLQLSNETGFPHEGLIDFADNRMDPNTGTILARGVFPNPQGWLTPGFFARIRVPGSGRYKAWLLPDTAVVTDQGQRLLLVVGPDNKVQSRPVELGALFGDLRAIRRGISAEDRVVIQGQLQARPGTVVAPHEIPVPTDGYVLTSPGAATTQALPEEREEVVSPSVDGIRASSQPAEVSASQPVVSQPAASP